jgi:hypothetical protein
MMEDGYSVNLASSFGLGMRGPYFQARNASPGTGIAMSITTTFSSTAALMLLYNNGGKTLILDFLRLICSAAGSTTTSSDLVIRTDAKDRYSSGGTSITLVNVSGSGETTGVSKCYFGTVVANAESSAIQQMRMRLKIATAPCWVVGDEVLIAFGTNQPTYSAITGTTATKMVHWAPAIIVPSGSSVTFHMWNTANATTAPSWEFELNWLELE